MSLTSGDTDFSTEQSEMLYARIDADGDAGSTITRAMRYRLTFEASKLPEKGVSTLHQIDTTKSHWSTTTLVDDVRRLIEAIELYKYVVNKTRNGATYMYCSQSRHHENNNLKLLDLQNLKFRHSESKRLGRFQGNLSVYKICRNIVIVRAAN